MSSMWTLEERNEERNGRTEPNSEEAQDSPNAPYPQLPGRSHVWKEHMDMIMSMPMCTVYLLCVERQAPTQLMPCALWVAAGAERYQPPLGGLCGALSQLPRARAACGGGAGAHGRRHALRLDAGGRSQ